MSTQRSSSATTTQPLVTPLIRDSIHGEKQYPLIKSSHTGEKAGQWLTSLFVSYFKGQ